MDRKRLIIALIAAFSAFFVYLTSAFFYPDVAKLKKETPKKTSFMKYTERKWKRKGIKRKISHVWVPYSRISPYLVKAVLIAEDDRFWRHEGFDFEAMEKALEKNIKAKKFKAGGSTISQQLAKNLYLSPSRTVFRKIREAILTWRIERSLSKRRILELYLNVAEWGDGIYGIEAASRHYYGLPAGALGPEEAVRLASVLPNPKRYSPVRPSRYVDNRSRIIYNIMVRRGIVVELEEDASEEGLEGNASEEAPAEAAPPAIENIPPSD
jgi:monofunctional biosynthetic peptidoglycan transglycosylase